MISENAAPDRLLYTIILKVFESKFGSIVCFLALTLFKLAGYLQNYAFIFTFEVAEMTDEYKICEKINPLLTTVKVIKEPCYLI